MVMPAMAPPERCGLRSGPELFELEPTALKEPEGEAEELVWEEEDLEVEDDVVDDVDEVG